MYQRRFGFVGESAPENNSRSVVTGSQGTPGKVIYQRRFAGRQATTEQPIQPSLPGNRGCTVLFDPGKLANPWRCIVARCRDSNGSLVLAVIDTGDKTGGTEGQVIVETAGGELAIFDSRALLEVAGEAIVGTVVSRLAGRGLRYLANVRIMKQRRCG